MQVFVLILSLISAAVGQNEILYPLPRFWTNTGFCPPGAITHEGISASLLTSEVKLNLHLIGALPNEALSTVRIHWLLELIQLIEFEKNHTPKYDFSKLDKLVWWMDRRELALGFEFMGNPSGVFTANASDAEFLWQDLAFQIGKRYLNRLGPSKIKKWRFESWNEPDLRGYNILNFDVATFQSYLHGLRRGLNAAGRRPVNPVHFKLHGPAGLFKRPDEHPLCWQTLEKCNANPMVCPINVLTYHHKGSGNSREVTSGGLRLLEEIFHKYPNLTGIPVANDEADPISGWSVPRDFQADMRYAIAVVSIIFDHWTVMQYTETFKNLEFISHDNAFISYHPHEFSQRTLFAHFRMNNSKPLPFSLFIQKPVYAVLGIMGNMGPYAGNVENVSNTIRLLQSTDAATFLSLVAISDATMGTYDRFQREISLKTMSGSNFSYIVEFLEFQNTDPVYVWNFYGSPAYPNSTVSEAMRKSQGPKLYTTGALIRPLLNVNLPIRAPWLVHIRLCSDLAPSPQRPRKLQIVPLTTREVNLFWKENFQTARCVVTYQVWFASTKDGVWKEITIDWHTPFLSFHFAPKDQQTKGAYKVRSIDTFGRMSEFSKTKEHK